MAGRFARGTLVIVMAVALAGFGWASTALAGKPQDVVEWSNGFPSGEHYNLNIHGKSWDSCGADPGGKSVFVPEYGAAQIDFVQNKKRDPDWDTLTAIDPCGGFDGGDDHALIGLPNGEYQVYAWIKAKPAKKEEPREVIFYPKLVEACNDSGTENFTDAVDCEESFLLGTGVVTTDGFFDISSQEFQRSKGKQKAVDITGAFAWTGYACDQAYDTDGDGSITLADVTTDLNGDGVIDEADLALYLDASCTYYDSEWVFNIADLVVYGWDYQNNGSKLVQVRFYPVQTTTFG